MTPEMKVIGGAVWVLLAIVAVMVAIAFSWGSDPTVCGSCPVEWQQQVILREMTP